jgi:hypothetical protein
MVPQTIRPLGDEPILIGEQRLLLDVIPCIVYNNHSVGFLLSDEPKDLHPAIVDTMFQQHMLYEAVRKSKGRPKHRL